MKESSIPQDLTSSLSFNSFPSKLPYMSSTQLLLFRTLLLMSLTLSLTIVSNATVSPSSKLTKICTNSSLRLAFS